MKLSILTFFSLIAGSLCMGKPSPVSGGEVDEDPSKYNDTVWRLVPQLVVSGGYYLIPLKVVSAKSQITMGKTTTLEVVTIQSTCTRDGPTQGLAVNQANCPPKPDGQRILQSLVIVDVPHRRELSVNLTKIRKVEEGEEI